MWVHIGRARFYEEGSQADCLWSYRFWPNQRLKHLPWFWSFSAGRFAVGLKSAALRAFRRSFWNQRKSHPKDPAVLKMPRDSKNVHYRTVICYRDRLALTSLFPWFYMHLSSQGRVQSVVNNGVYRRVHQDYTHS